MNTFLKHPTKGVFGACGWSGARRTHVEDFIKQLPKKNEIEIKYEYMPGTSVVSKLKLNVVKVDKADEVGY